MRNLKLLNVTHSGHPLLANVKSTCLNADTGTIYVVNSKKQLFAIREEFIELCPNVYPASDDWENILLFEYVLEHDHILLVFEKGGIIIVDKDTGICDCVGIVSSGINAVAISPDQELLVVATNEDKLILMSNSYEPITEKMLNPEEYGAGRSVNVGWGSKQTQFHGSEGKEAAKAVGPSVKGVLECDDRKTRITWRTDGQMFAISSVDTQTNCRIFRVWDSTLELQHTGEIVPGQEGRLSWKPNSNIIASSRQHFGKHEIIFIEKNGLVHGSFELPFAERSFSIQQVSWSADGKVLLVQGLTIDKSTTVLLWTVSNYHWYLKQVLTLEVSDNLVQLIWDQNNPLSLFAILESGRLSKYEFQSCVTSSKENELFVIDGKSVLVTPFNACIVPPPMSAFSYKFEKFINFLSCENSDMLVRFHDNETLILKRNNSPDVTFQKENFKISQTLHTHGMVNQENYFVYDAEVVPKLRTHFVTHCVLLENSIFGVMFDSPKNYSLFFIDRSNLESFRILSSAPMSVLHLSKGDSTVGIVFADGSLHRFDSQTLKVSEWLDERGVSVKVPSCQLIQIGFIDRLPQVFWLSLSGNLYRNNTLLQKLCTSIMVTDSFLIFTNNKTLNCISFKNLNDVEQLNLQETERPIEIGSELVAVTNQGGVLVQTPRGNLETVYPRSILWNSILKLLSTNSYIKAFEMMRKNRMNLNLLCDHDLEKFCNDIPVFIDQLGTANIQHINLFITDLNDKIAAPPGTRTRICAAVDTNKISNICQRLRTVLSEKPELYLHPILASFAKEGRIGEALIHIHKLSSEKQRNDSLKFLLYMVDINSLCDEALGTYDIDIVLMVSEKSQKDPREYSQFLDKIQSYTPEEYRKYKIDVHLKRFEKALSHVSNSNNLELFSECLLLIEKHRLYTESLRIFPDKERLDRIYLKYADYLLAKRYYDEAGLAYKRAEDYNNALKSYMLSGNWNAAISMCILGKCSEDDLQKLCQKIVENLSSEGKYIEASSVVRDFLRDARRSCAILIDGQQWDHCVRALSQLQDSSLVDHYKTKLNEHFNDSLENVQSVIVQLSKHVDRLKVVREDRTKNVQFLEDIPDNESEISGISSRTSGSRNSGSLGTRRTSKTSRKLNKGYSLKEGNTFEDLALIQAVKDMSNTIASKQSEIGLLIRHLCENGFELKAKNLQNCFLKLIEDLEKAFEVVWPDESNIDKTTHDLISSQNEEFISDVRLRIRPEFKNLFHSRIIF